MSRIITSKRKTEIIEKFKKEIVPQNDPWQGTVEVLERLLNGITEVEVLQPYMVMLNDDIGEFFDDLAGELLYSLGYRVNKLHDIEDDITILSNNFSLDSDYLEFWVKENSDNINACVLDIQVEKRYIDTLLIAKKKEYTGKKFNAKITKVNEDFSETIRNAVVICRTSNEEEILMKELKGELSVEHEFFLENGEVVTGSQIVSVDI